VRPKLRPLVALVLAVGLLAGCAGGVPSGAAATVNGEEIPRDLVERIVVAQLEGPGGPAEEERDEVEAEIQRNVLSTLIGVQIVAQLAADRGIEPSEEDLDAELAEQRDLAGGDEGFDGFLETIGLGEGEYRDLIVADIVRREQLAAELGEEVSDADVEAAYEAQLETNVNSRHILVETEDEAEDILARLDDGEDFADLAEELGTDGTAAVGGDLGFADTTGFVPEFAAALEENDPGTVVGPVETEFGFHVLEVLDPPPFEELEDEIRAELEQQAATSPALIEAFEEAFTGAEVEVGSGFGEWDSEQGRLVDPDAVGEGGDVPPQGDVPADGEGISEEELQELLDEELGNVDAP
jgi:foldase protein PrsA